MNFNLVGITNYESLLVQAHAVMQLATCLRNGYAIPLGYAEFERIVCGSKDRLTSEN